MTHVTFGTYWPLLLLLLIPCLWWFQRHSALDMSAWQLKLGGALRSAIIGLVVLALMQPVWHRPGTQVSVVYLVDVSESMTTQSIQSAIEWIRQAGLAGHPAHERFIPFAANSLVFDRLNQLENAPVAKTASAGSIDRSATDIEEAVSRALRSFAPHHLKRLVLISDGNENSGRLMHLASSLQANGVRTFALIPRPRADGDAWVEAIRAPLQIPADQLFSLGIEIYSLREVEAEVEVRSSGAILGARRVRLIAGPNQIGFETRIRQAPGPIELEALVKTPGDPFEGNDRLRSSLVVTDRPKILYVEGQAESAHYLGDALRRAGLDVHLMRPSDLPESEAQLDIYDAVILSDVPRDSLSERQMSALARYVRDLGGGFILAGGENVFGRNGYSNTAVEEVLPVTFDAKKEKPESLALTIVLDKSGSMGGPKIQLAKEATKAALNLLRDVDLFGVVAFDFNSYWVARLQPAANRTAIAAAVAAILPGGDTNMYPALNESFGALEQLPAHVKHVILLSDGFSVPNDFQELVRKMDRANITVSTVAVGDGADRDLLANIATWGEGRSYFIKDAASVAEIFTQETRLAGARALREQPFRPEVRARIAALKGVDFTGAPPLLGYVLVKPKPTAEIILEHTMPGRRDKDPILARWHCGLGTAAVFSSDVKDRWAAEWLQWRGYAKFWSQLVRATMRIPSPETFDFRVQRSNKDVKMTINALSETGRFRNRLDLRVQLTGANIPPSTVPLRQVAPGTYEAYYPLPQRGTYRFRALGWEAPRNARILADPYPEEYHFYPPNVDLLNRITAETGGAIQPKPRDIFDPHGERSRLPIPLWPFCAGAALVLYWIDLFLRRLGGRTKFQQGEI
jgi:Ca-activated chloride channel family protein